jgi:hypothetical protein
LREAPEDILHPPHAFRFSYSVEGKTIDGDTPLTVRKRGQQTFKIRAMRKPYQGNMLRISQSTNITPKSIGRRGARSILCRHTSSSHTQAFYKNKIYRQLHENFENVPQVEGKELQRDLNLVCPFCRIFNSEVGNCRGNQRHFHIYCANRPITLARNLLYDCLEETLKKVDYANKTTEMTHRSQNLIMECNEGVVNISDNVACLMTIT